MKRILIVLAVAGAVGGVGAVKAHEGHKHVKAKAAVSASTPGKIHLTGELVDPQCWFTHHGEGKDHAECAVTCAQGGQDLAFLDQRTGELYTLIATAHGKNPNAGLYEHVGVPVTVYGTAYQRGGNRALLLEGVKKAR